MAKSIRRGWQYTVYDVGNGRMLKKYNTWLEAYLVMLRDAIRHARLPVFCFTRYYRAGKESALRSLKALSDSALDQTLFGNPKLLADSAYEQSYAEPLAVYFARTSADEGRRTVEKFVEFNKMLVGHTLCEKNFNIGDNFGVDGVGNIVLIDLGEICTTQDEIQDRLRLRVWSAPDVLSRIPTNLRPYFVEKMDEAFT